MITEKVYKDRNYQRMYTHNAVHSMMPNINIRSVVYKIPTVIHFPSLHSSSLSEKAAKERIVNLNP